MDSTAGCHPLGGGPLSRTQLDKHKAHKQVATSKHTPVDSFAQTSWPRSSRERAAAAAALSGCSACRMPKKKRLLAKRLANSLGCLRERDCALVGGQSQVSSEHCDTIHSPSSCLPLKLNPPRRRLRGSTNTRDESPLEQWLARLVSLSNLAGIG